mmetsp:Transcript_25763/g.86408  ORF Transcript_25763/g.86408 Transcript_25763/m.86408 type:complete len:274 (+) Transcript_25763:47-868(+)
MAATDVAMPTAGSVRGDRVLSTFLGLGVVTFGVTYSFALSVDTTKLRIPFIFLSESINYAPSSCFGSLLLSPACAAFALVVILRHEQLRTLCSTVPRTRALGLLSAAAGHGVASFQLKNLAVAHFLCAYLFFFCTTAYIVLAVRHERRHGVPARWALGASLRMTCAVLAPVFVLYTCAIGPLILWHFVGSIDHYADDERKGTTQSMAEFVVVMTLAVSEICMYLFFAGFFATLFWELRAVELKLLVTRHVGADHPSANSLHEPFINYIADTNQ